EALRTAFEALHRQLYGYATGEGIECVNLRVVARVPDVAVELPSRAPADAREPSGEQRAWFVDAGEVTLRRHDRAALPPGRVGDVWFANLPEMGGTHLPDVKAIRPVFASGRLVAFAINLAHWADIGGAVPGSYVPWATESYQEGVRISPVRLFSADGPDREKLDFLLANLRGRDEREGDMFAQFAANDVAARRLAELCDRHGADTLAKCFDALHEAY